MKRFAAWLFAASVAAGAAGCAQPPTADINAARTRVEALPADGAAYAPDAYNTAREALAQLDAEAQAQSEKFALTRSYTKTSELAAAAEAAVDRAEAAVKAEKERLEAAAREATADARRALEEATAALKNVPEADVAALQTDLTAAESSLTEVDSLLAAGRIEEAQQAVTAARQKIGQAADRIDGAIQEAETVARAETERRSPDRTVVPRAVLADGQRLAAGTYRLRVTDQTAPPVGGQLAGTERWIEFVRNGKVAGRALAVVLTPVEVREVAESPAPGSGEVSVDVLKGHDYVRVWLNQGGTNYLVHLPVA